MTVSTALIETSRHFPGHSPDAIFQRWTVPVCRRRWETPDGSGMSYEAFDLREGGVERVAIHQDGAEIGRLVQRIVRLDPPRLIVVSTEGHFGGAPAMTMQIATAFAAEGGGTRLTATAQVMDLTGRDVEAEHRGGWETLFDRFSADLDAHRPMPGDTA